MRSLALALAILTAGCVVPGLQQASVDLALPEIPEGATVEAIEGGVRLVFDAVGFPFEQNVAIPEGTTLVRVTGIVAGEHSVSATLRHADTLRRRCNLAPLDAWDVPLVGTASCTGVTMVDRLPATWQVRAGSAAAEGTVQVDLLTAPVDGVLAELDTSQLSMRDFEIEGTTVVRVPSFDGTQLHVEVTLPTGPGPWPTIIASSPYNHADRLASGLPAMWAYFVRDWAERGYAIVVADVRGYGQSDGCVEVWGPREQADQTFLVEWVAKQEWSDGNVGFYGQSYAGTTPVEASIDAPEALKAIVAVAPVVDAYNDWHFGGVPNGENSRSPLAYYQIGAAMPSAPVGSAEPARYEDFVGAAFHFAQHVDNGFCDPTVLARANDPRGVYDAFYVERNFSARAPEVRAAVLYTQGFEDSNVKSALIPDWFNALSSPKLGLFGHWVHQHPTRADNEALFLLWFDQHVKGRPVGFEAHPSVRVVTNEGAERLAEVWPPAPEGTFALHLDPAGGALAPEPADGSAPLFMGSGVDRIVLPLGRLLPTTLTMASAPLEERVHFAGQGVVHVEATLQHAQNAYLAAYLYEVVGDERSLVTWGMFNLAHRNGHDRYDPVGPQERVRVGIPLLPTEWVFAPGAALELEMHSTGVMEWSLTPPTEPGALEVYAEGSALELPVVADVGAPLPASAQR